MRVDYNWLQSQFPDLKELKPLSSGGQKWVLSCQDPHHGDCVLKLIKPGAEDRLDREIEAVTRIASEYIPKIYRVSKVDSQFGELIYFLEQRIDGITLRQRLYRGPLTKEELIKLARNLLMAARIAESVKVVHRDIKPDNIMLDRNNNAWLLDFGIARILDLSSKTRTDAVSGPHTPGYGAPEQFKYSKKDIDGRTDLFAIGIVLYESSTGKNPFIFGARDRLEVLRRVERMPLPNFNLTWDTKNEFSGFVSSLSQKQPYQRPSSCDEALEWFLDISKDLGGE